MHGKWVVSTLNYRLFIAFFQLASLMHQELDENESAKEQFIKVLTQYENELAARNTPFYGG